MPSPESSVPSVGLPCLCATIRRASRIVTRLYDEHLTHVRLRSTQYTLLRALADAGPVRQTDLAEVLLADPTTLSRTLAPLRREGWIVEQPSDDKREKVWSLSASGRRKLDQAENAWSKAQASMRSALSASQWEQLRSLLDLVSAQAAKTA